MKTIEDVNINDFAVMWQSATEVKPIAKKFGITPAECSRLAAMLRKKGIALKKFRSRKEITVDVKAMNKLLFGK